MSLRQIDQSPKTFIIVFQTGDERASGLLGFAKDQGPVRRNLQGHWSFEFGAVGLV